MPVSRVGPPVVAAVDVFAPDKTDDSVFQVPVTFALETPEKVPDNMADLPLEEQQRIINRLKFMGIRCRHDLRDFTIPLSRETLDIP